MTNSEDKIEGAVDEPEVEKPKASKKKAAVFEDVSIIPQRLNRRTVPTAVFSTPKPPKAGDKIEIKTEGGHHYAGTCDEVEEIDGQYCVTFTNEGLQPA